MSRSKSARKSFRVFRWRDETQIVRVDQLGQVSGNGGDHRQTEGDARLELGRDRPVEDVDVFQGDQLEVRLAIDRMHLAGGHAAAELDGLDSPSELLQTGLRRSGPHDGETETREIGHEPGGFDRRLEILKV